MINKFSNQVKTSLLIIQVFFQLFFMSHCSEMMMHEASLVGDSAYKLYENLFYIRNKRLLYAVSLIILRSQNTNGLTAGKFFNISMNTFTSVCIFE